ncbi:DUF1697 domain-containing protein [Flagellimonas sp. HMM57]|uniref:DUF1697 domain-containing protein n=1 Tax=unclassified Flagellimonas TaxID=2644544 RepID=UPI0013D1B6F4|nr:MULTISPECIES: DUF1697 domain-containing protein [unclassified Flagellimonas]UII74633.1 DUF1697 domain-containing protein [Flagellimonas sp. HMM57]
MKTYVALLRGINVSGQKKIRMADLKQSLENYGLHKVTTYIQSGNVVFESEVCDAKQLEKTIHEIILNDFGFSLPTLVATGEVLAQILDANPFNDQSEENRLYFVLLKHPPEKILKEKFKVEQFVNEDFHITDTCVYLCCKKGYGNAKLNNNLIERKLKVEATTRNLKTMQKLIAMVEE